MRTEAGKDLNLGPRAPTFHHFLVIGVLGATYRE
jgi:hypothetical protein